MGRHGCICPVGVVKVCLKLFKWIGEKVKSILTALCFAAGLLAQPGPVANSGCTKQYVASTITSSGATQLIGLPSSPINYTRICAVDLQVIQGSTAANFGLVSGTGSACATNQNSLTAAWQGVAGAIQTYSRTVPVNVGWFVPAGQALCLNLSSAPTNAAVTIWYDSY
jgi:hypothetical protein